MRRHQSLFSHAFQTLRQAPHRSQTSCILCSVILVLSLCGSLETLHLILADLNSPFVGCLALALLIQLLVSWLCVEKLLKVTCFLTSAASKHDPESTE